MRALALLLFVLAGPVWAQAGSAAGTLPAPPAVAGVAPERAATPADAARADRRIERIRVEDAGSRIDEVRYGGETQSITVQTKSGLPAYEIVPANGARNRPAGERDAAAGSSGQRVWKLFDF